jgi:DNA helicase-2/ATP-dependent DNA helicase PcrA
MRCNIKQKGAIQIMDIKAKIQELISTGILKFTPSKYQEDVFHNIVFSEDHLAIMAVAGSGKTTTIEAALNFIPTTDKVDFVAFNKTIAQELGKRAPKHVRARTMHSMGLAALNKTQRRKVYGNKLFEITKDVADKYPALDRDASKAVFSLTLKVIPLLKGELMEPTDKNIDAICFKHGLEVPHMATYNFIKDVFQASLDDERTVDFDDMIFKAVKEQAPVEVVDWLFVDEAQDLNAAQVELLMMAVGPDTRVIVVGDPYQSIYGFRGADTEAMPKLIKRLGAKELPLSICYRCPPEHIEIAQQYVPHIEANPEHAPGKVEDINVDLLFEYVSPEDLCVCRFNAPLVRPAFDLLRMGVKVCIRGRDIGQGLIKLIDQMKVSDIDKLYDKLYDWKEAQVAKAEAKGANPQSIEDKYDTIVEFIEANEFNNATELKDYIKDLFSDDRAQVTFSSVHRAKGLEADNVFIIAPESMPSKYANKDWEIQQEANIQYVAVTRAKKALYFVRV